MSVHNGEPYLRESVESVLNQTFPDFEFIVIDDASTDGTGAILDDFDDPRLVRLSNAGNLGLTRSLNCGLKIAKGEFVARQDADDVSLPLRLAKQVRYLESHPDVGVVGTHTENVRGAALCSHSRPPAGHSLIAWQLLWGHTPVHPTVMVRREVIESAGGYDEAFQVSQDYELWSRLVETTRFANIPEVLLRYRVHAGSVSGRQLQQQIENTVRIRQQLVKRALGLDVEDRLLRWTDSNHCGVLEDDQITLVVDLILKLFAAAKDRGFIEESDEKEVYADVLKRITRTCRRSPDFIDNMRPLALARRWLRARMKTRKRPQR